MVRRKCSLSPRQRDGELPTRIGLPGQNFYESWSGRFDAPVFGFQGCFEVLAYAGVRD